MSKNKSMLFWICALSVIASIGVHVYLTNHHYDFKFGQDASGGICNINETVNCNRTTSSSYSEFLGIPVSIFGGLIHFFLLGLLICFRFPVVAAKTQQELGGPIRLISLFIFTTSVIMASVSFIILNTICPACTIAYALSLITLLSAWLLTSGQKLFSPSNIKIYIGLAVAVMAFAYFINHNKLRNYGGKEQMEYIALQFADWKNSPPKQFTPHQAIIKNPNPAAKVKIVEFADYLCGHCATAFPTIKAFVNSHPDVEFSFQAWPLDGACNKAINHSEGTRCMLAALAQCADQQGKAFQVQEWIFRNQRQLLSKDNVISQLSQNQDNLGINKEQLLKCAESDEIKQIIRKQADAGIDAGVKGTPSLYINGKKVPPGFSIPLLQKIYLELQ